MKRWLPVITLFAMACVLPSLTLETPIRETAVTTTQALRDTVAPVVIPTFTPTPQTPESPSTDAYPELLAESIHIYPSPIFPGDYMSIDIVPYIPVDVSEPMTVTAFLPDGSDISQEVTPYGLDGELRARYLWVNQVPEGASVLTLTFTLAYPDGVHPGLTHNMTLTKFIDITPISMIPPPEPEAQWALTTTTGFDIHYITGTRADRELSLVVAEANQAYDYVTDILGRSRDVVDIYILGKVIGQGGYASPDWIAISYPDRLYSPIGISSLLKHELTHRLDASIGCADGPTFIREGLAVFLAGGHYREESIVTKASTAMSNGYVTPFNQLVSDFYLAQHEIAYTEAAAFIFYIDEIYGWEGVKQLCKVSSQTEGDDLEKIDAAAIALVDTDAVNLIGQYRQWLSQQPVNSSDEILFEYELQLMELMRQYQLNYDPAAHFLEGILFSPEQGMREDIVADFIRGPVSDEAITLELLIASGQDAVIRQDIAFLRTLLTLLDDVLIDRRKDVELFNNIVQLVQYIRTLGYEPYNLIFLGENEYEVSVKNTSNLFSTSTLVFSQLSDDGRWIISNAP